MYNFKNKNLTSQNFIINTIQSSSQNVVMIYYTYYNNLFEKVLVFHVNFLFIYL